MIKYTTDKKVTLQDFIEDRCSLELNTRRLRSGTYEGLSELFSYLENNREFNPEGFLFNAHANGKVYLCRGYSYINTGHGGELLLTEALKEMESTQNKNDILSETKAPQHYDNSKGSLYQFAEDHQLNSYEFDICKRIIRSRKKGNFREDLEKSKFLIDLYLQEQGHLYETKTTK